MREARELARLARDLARCTELDCQLQLVCDRLCELDGIAHAAITVTGLREQPMLFVDREIPEVLQHVAAASASAADEAILLAMPDLRLKTTTIQGPHPGDRGRIIAFL